MIVYLVRHGERLPRLGRSDGELLSVGLSMFGKMQARSTGVYLRGRGIAKIISSPLLRAKETAEEIGNILHLSVEEDARLSEYVADLNATDEKYLKALKLKTYADPSFVPPSGESLNAGAERFVTLLTELSKESFSAVCLVSHAIEIETVLARLLGYNEGVHDYIKNASVTAIEIGKDVPPKLLFVNHTYRNLLLLGMIILRKLKLL